MSLKAFFKEWNVVIVLVISKIIIHAFAITRYGFHRDEYLYIDATKHLDWGFMEIPPFLPFIGRISSILFGDSIVAVRLFPLLAGIASIILIGIIVRDLGGGKRAQALACLAYLVSPAFLRCSHMFMPVVFNQLSWLGLAVLLVKLVKSDNPKYWYSIGLIAGIGFLTKYSILFYLAGLGLAILISPHRKWAATKYPYLALLIAFVIALPNLLWQYNLDFPVVGHMQELAETQLVHMNPAAFFMGQAFFHTGGLLIWLPGLIYLLMPGSKLKDYRFLGLGFIFLLAFLLFTSGKAYYTLGAYPALMAAGGVAAEQFFIRKKRLWFSLFFFVILSGSVCFMPYGLPFLPIKTMEKYCKFMAERTGFNMPLRWEDGNFYPIPQDFADMVGWDEIPAKVAKFYHSLPETDRKNCMIWGGSYGHAGVLNYAKEAYQLPVTQSLNSSYALWANPDIKFDRQILVDEEKVDSSTWFYDIILFDSIDHPLSRDRGYMYYRTNPRIDVQERWKELIIESRE